jgi:hypothetical protein
MVLFNLKNPIIILGLLTCISFTTNCNMITDNWISFYQSIYGIIFSLVTLIALIALVAYKMTRAFEVDTYIFEDYKLGKKSPRTLKKIN